TGLHVAGDGTGRRLRVDRGDGVAGHPLGTQRLQFRVLFGELAVRWSEVGAFRGRDTEVGAALGEADLAGVPVVGGDVDHHGDVDGAEVLSGHRLLQLV